MHRVTSGPLASPTSWQVWVYLLLLSFSCLNPNRGHDEPWPTVPLSPRDDGLDSVPNVFPDGRSFPFQFDHHQLSNINIQRNKKSVGFILSDAFNSNGEKKTYCLGLCGTGGSICLCSAVPPSCLCQVPLQQQQRQISQLKT